jgi:hypothetical protein
MKQLLAIFAVVTFPLWLGAFVAILLLAVLADLYTTVTSTILPGIREVLREQWWIHRRNLGLEVEPLEELT